MGNNELSIKYLPQGNQTARELLDAYFELKEKYAEEGISTSKVEKPIIKAFR